MVKALAYPGELLRGHAWWVEGGETRARLAQLCAMLVLFGLLYGAVMGTFGGVSGERAWQVLYSSVKVPLLLLCTFALSIPSFFVINSLYGLREDFAYTMRALVATQTGLTVILAAFAPLTAVWYLSFPNYNLAILFNGLMFGGASVGAQVLLRRFYGPLIARDPRHRTLLRAWLVIYAFVGIQMGWVLRPFVGSPDAPVRLFRESAWGNGYVELFMVITNALGY